VGEYFDRFGKPTGANALKTQEELKVTGSKGSKIHQYIIRGIEVI